MDVFCLTEEDADSLEDTEKTQFLCVLSSFQIASVSVSFLASPPPRCEPENQISFTHNFPLYIQLHFSPLSTTRLLGYVWSILGAFSYFFV